RRGRLFRSSRRQFASAPSVGGCRGFVQVPQYTEQRKMRGQERERQKQDDAEKPFGVRVAFFVADVSVLGPALWFGVRILHRQTRIAFRDRFVATAARISAGTKRKRTISRRFQ